MNNLICQAINNKSIIVFDYNGIKCTVEPHCCGTTTDGQEVIYGYQLNVEPNKWAIFELNKISGLGLDGQYFSRARDGFNPDKIGFTNIICKIKY